MRKSTKLLAAAMMICMSLVLAACSSGGSSTPSTSGGAGTASGTTVVEKGFAFNPATLTVKVGDVVTFSNEDSTAHEVKIDGQDLGQQDPGKSVTWTAAKAGTFPYQCVIHPSMTGTIIVK